MTIDLLSASLLKEILLILMKLTIEAVLSYQITNLQKQTEIVSSVHRYLHVSRTGFLQIQIISRKTQYTNNRIL